MLAAWHVHACRHPRSAAAVLLLQGQHQQMLQGKFLLQVDEVVNIAAGFKERCGSVC